MAFSIIQNISAAGYSGTSAGVAFSALTNGSKIILNHTCENPSNTFSSISDTVNTYATDSQGKSRTNQFAGDGISSIFRADNTSTSALTATVTLGSSDVGYIKGYECTGLASGGPVAESNSGNSSQGFFGVDDSLTTNVTSANCAGFRVGTYYNNTGFAVDSGWTLEVNNLTGSLAYHAMERISDTGSTGNKTTTFSSTNTLTNGSGCQAFYALASSSQTVTVGIVSETDSALAIAKLKSKTVGLTSETETGLGTTKKKSKTVGLTTETDSALATGRVKAIDLELAEETDSALAATATGNRIVNTGLAAETDSGLTVAHTKAKTVGLSSETDSALAATRIKLKMVGLTTETDSSFSVSHKKAKTIGLATEADDALAASVTVDGAVATGLAVETDSALAATRLKVRSVDLIVGIDSALGVTSGRFIEVGLTSEADSVFSVAHTKSRQVGLALEVDSVLGMSTDFTGIEIFLTGTYSYTIQLTGRMGG